MSSARVRQFSWGTSAIVLLGLSAAMQPAEAQVVLPDVSIEGPIASVSVGATGEASVVGTLQVMGVTVKVLSTTSIHSPTNPSLTVGDLVGAALPGRTQAGFVGGTAIVNGDSQAGDIYAADLFVEPAENVVVGEATGVLKDAQGVDRLTINKMVLVPLEDPRIPAGRPINGFGFHINTSGITNGSLVSAEGYYSGIDNVLHYFNLEADTGTLVNAAIPEVSILRAQCRIRGRNRDEMEVRGGTHTPPNATVTIQYLNAAGSWITLPGNAVPVVDTTVVPPQGLYRYNRTNLSFGTAVCPAQVRASFPATVPLVNRFSAPFAPDSR